VEQSRRDDLECFGYCLVYLYKGSLPWQGLKAKNQREKYLKICDIKISQTPYKLCEDCPSEFIEYFEYVRSLVFEEIPDYKYLKGLLEKILIRNNINLNSDLDWSSSDIVIC
jgi:hypothetical protein